MKEEILHEFSSEMPSINIFGNEIVTKVGNLGALFFKSKGDIKLLISNFFSTLFKNRKMPVFIGSK